MKKITALLFSVLLIITLSSAQTFACSCMMPGSPKEAADMASSVFIGKVIKKSKTNPLTDGLSYMTEVEVYFDVSGVIKGDKYKNISLTTTDNGASCGYNFQEGKDYIVYTYGEGSELSTGLCTRTSLLENATDDLNTFKDILDEDLSYNEYKNDKLIKNITWILIVLSITTILIMKKRSEKSEEKKD